MKRLVIASLRRSAGKTSVIVGLGLAANKKIGYLKPFGERLLYRKKRLWDYDSALVTQIFGLKEDPVDMSIGFDHSKLRFMYDEESTKRKLLEIIEHIAQGKDLLFLEGGRDLTYGVSIHLDPLSLAKFTESKLFLVVSGEENAILDDIYFLKKHLDLKGAQFGGLLINKVQNLEEFQEIQLPLIRKLNLPILGVLPYQSDLTYFSMAYLAERLFAKVITGEKELSRPVKNILIGAWSASTFMQNPVFQKESKLIITGGDRTDMILAALESDTAGIILTNNVLPPSHIIAKAEERRVPMLMVFSDTYQTAKQIESLEPLLTKEDEEKIKVLAELVKKYLDWPTVLEN